MKRARFRRGRRGQSLRDRHETMGAPGASEGNASVSATEVFLIGNYKPDAQMSMLLLFDELRAGIAVAGRGFDAWQPTETVPHRGSPHAGAGKWIGYANKFPFGRMALKRRLRDIPREVPVHLLDQGNAPLLGAVGDRRVVATCHDLIAIREAFGRGAGRAPRWSGRRLQRWIARHFQRADRIACISENTRRDLVDLFPDLAERASVIPVFTPQALAPVERNEALRRLSREGEGADGWREPFFLHVGGNAWYKNRNGLIDAYALYRRRAGAPVRLVLAGAPLTSSARERIRAAGIEDCVIDLGPVDGERLEALYSLATAFLFPSLYEGFGLPPLEAQMCDCPVVCSDAASLPEVVGDSAELADPSDVDAWASAMENLASDADRRRELVERGRRNRERFSRERTVEAYRRLYAELRGA